MKMTAPGRLAMLCWLTTVLVGGCCSEEGGPEWECLTIDTQPTTITIRDYQYERFRFFDLGLMGDTNVLLSGDVITQFRFFQSISSTGSSAPIGCAYLNWLDPEESSPIVSQFRPVSYIEPSEFAIFPEEHYLLLPHRLPAIESSALAYFMIYRHANGDLDTVERVDSDTLGLQLLKVPGSGPGDPLWDAEWKNVYDLGTSDIVYDRLAVDIFRGAVGDESNPENPTAETGVPYLQVFGLDFYTADGVPGSDGKIDRNSAILDLDLGLLIFPHRLPFADSHLAEPVPEIYSAATEEERQAASKYYLRVITDQRSQMVDLGRVNITEDSEEITLDGIRLTRGPDYTIDYDLGIVEFKRIEVLDPDVSLVICYEYGRCCP